MVGRGGAAIGPCNMRAERPLFRLPVAVRPVITIIITSESLLHIYGCPPPPPGTKIPGRGNIHILGLKYDGGPRQVTTSDEGHALTVHIYTGLPENQEARTHGTIFPYLQLFTSN